jgi:quercetin dioxygenase-like cupin family protein
LAFPLCRCLLDLAPISAAYLPARSTGTTDMTQSLKAFLYRSLAIAGASMMASSAFAGECPACAMKPNAREQVNFQPVGVTDTTLGSIDLGKEMVGAKDHELRFRKLTVAPGGIVPWHSHDDRPALIFVAEGEIMEYASNCAQPIVHKAGDIRPETRGTSHWWKNLGDKTVVLYVGDVLHDKSDHNM